MIMQYLNNNTDPLSGHHRYQILSLLGRGSSAFVMRALDRRNNEEVAIKFVPRARSPHSRNIEREILNHSMLRHPNIIQFKGLFLTREYICIILELASCGSLQRHILNHGGRLSEAKSRFMFQQLMMSVDYIHKRGVANRDLKLENTLLQHVPSWHPHWPLLKICDFGHSKLVTSGSAAKSKAGTPSYMAPEVILCDGETEYDGKLADIWSCGVMLYTMLHGDYPFHTGLGSAVDVSRILNEMMTRRFLFSHGVPLSADCRDLLERMLQPDPRHRITLQEILRHAWFTTDLPPEAIPRNATYLHQQINQSAIERTRALVWAAQYGVQTPDAFTGEEHAVYM